MYLHIYACVYTHAYKYIIALLKYIYVYVYGNVCTDKYGKKEIEKSQNAQTSGGFSWKSNDEKPT